NAQRLPEAGRAAVKPPAGRVLTLLQDDLVHYNGQPIAVIVADTVEHARDAARLVRVEYAIEPALLRFDEAKKGPHRPDKDGATPTDKSWGDVDAGMAAGEVRVDAVYATSIEHHNPMAPHATVAQWTGAALVRASATRYASSVPE